MKVPYYYFIAVYFSLQSVNICFIYVYAMLAAYILITVITLVINLKKKKSKTKRSHLFLIPGRFQDEDLAELCCDPISSAAGVQPERSEARPPPPFVCPSFPS